MREKIIVNICRHSFLFELNVECIRYNEGDEQKYCDNYNTLDIRFEEMFELTKECESNIVRRQDHVILIIAEFVITLIGLIFQEIQQDDFLRFD